MACAIYKSIKISENDWTVPIRVRICFRIFLLSRIMLREPALVEKHSIIGCIYHWTICATVSKCSIGKIELHNVRGSEEFHKWRNLLSVSIWCSLLSVVLTPQHVWINLLQGCGNTMPDLSIPGPISFRTSWKFLFICPWTSTNVLS